MNPLEYLGSIVIAVAIIAFFALIVTPYPWQIVVGSAIGGIVTSVIVALIHAIREEVVKED